MECVEGMVHIFNILKLATYLKKIEQISQQIIHFLNGQ